ncbi:hypothetical protein [Mycobacterium sp. AT1]|uniref:hypothetical protein n=1 Tax=Mycobacterium sp. AT1 TaxID=1961706 RepID=UPI0011506F4E|nr:hypothetical protein [Mycobacterium sp. AT1]
MRFEYDVEDVYGNCADTVVVKDEDIDFLVEVMDRPIGVIWGFSDEAGRYLPFMHEGPTPETDEIKDDGGA